MKFTAAVITVSVLLGGASACTCAEPDIGEPKCAFQYVLVGTTIESFNPRCPDPVTRDDDAELVFFDDVSKTVSTFEVETILKQPLLEVSPAIAPGDVVQVWTASDPEACGFAMEEGEKYILTAFAEDLEGCTANRDEQLDPGNRLKNVGTTACSMNTLRPSVELLLQWAEDCEAEFGPVVEEQAEAPAPSVSEICDAECETFCLGRCNSKCSDTDPESECYGLCAQRCPRRCRRRCGLEAADFTEQ